MYCVEWIPTEIGDHLATIYLGRHAAEGFPQIIKVYDADKVVATFPSHGYVGEKCQIECKLLCISFLNV
jgi:hypothetical protein